MTKTHRDDDLGSPGGGERYLPPQYPADVTSPRPAQWQPGQQHMTEQERAERNLPTYKELHRNSRLAADLMRQDSNASAGEANAKLRRALAATGYLHKSEAPE